MVYTVHLPRAIRKYNIERISESVKEQIYSKLVSLNINSKENRKMHVQAIHNKLTFKQGILPAAPGS